MRVSLFGGGSDYPTYVREYGGEVLGFSLNKFTYLTLRKLPPFFSYKHRICWSEIELVKDWCEIKHPVIREVMKRHGPDYGIELHHDGDLPARSGLGSSSSFTVGLLHAAFALHGKQASKQDLAQRAIHMEQDVLKENVGAQDQVWAAYGGFNHIVFNTDGGFDVRPVIVPSYRKSELNRSLMLFFTGFSRIASEVAKKQIDNIPKRRRQIKIMREMVGEALTVLNSPQTPLLEIGKLLHEGWRLKRELADGISNDMIDTIYEAGRAAGAVGGKLLGAGGGGFLLFFVPFEKQKAVRERLADLVNVSFEIGSEGSRVAIYEPNGL